MAKKIDFDIFIDRKKSHCVKYGVTKERFGKSDILPLWVADTDFAVPKEVQKVLQKRASHPIYGYSIYPKSYYKAVIYHMQSLGLQVKKKHILTVPSTVMAINIALQTFCKNGDGVIVQTPIYPPFLSSVKNNGLKLLENRLIFKKNYTIDFSDFAKKAKEAKCFILCNPHNPTGRVFSKNEIKKLAQICQKEGVLIIADEIHADIIYENSVHTPIAKFAPQLTITLNAPSKTYSLTGLSSAYAIIYSDFIKRRFHRALQKLGYHIANPFSIEACSVALGQKEYKKQLVHYLENNLEYLLESFKKIEMIDAIYPEGTFLLWLDCRKMGLDDKQLQRFFVDEVGLGLNSGCEFGEAGSGFMRLNFATPRKNLELAMKRLILILC